MHENAERQITKQSQKDVKRSILGKVGRTGLMNLEI
jgi:hypothetical protein